MRSIFLKLSPILIAVCIFFFLYDNDFGISPKSSQGTSTHGIAVNGTLKYPATFTHYDYANPKAPKGGELYLGGLGTFDSLNYWIVRGTPGGYPMLTIATLLSIPDDEIFSAYLYVAQSIELAPDKSWVIFTLNPDARFSNGEPITVEDVIFSFEVLRDHGKPGDRNYYKNVISVEKLGEHKVKFSFNTTTNRELPLILGELPIFSKKFYETHPFDEPSINIPPSSGPYEIEDIRAGKSITYKRVQNWWAANISSQRGLYNFERVHINYYFDSLALFEAFKAGQIDMRKEDQPRLWKKGYNFAAVKEGYVKLKQIEDSLSSGTYGLFFNTRREIFSNKLVRQALTQAFDFEWVNKDIFYNMCVRNVSYFPKSEYESHGLPKGKELEILEKFRDKLPPQIFAEAFSLSVTDASGNPRAQLNKAAELLKGAGFEIKGERLVNKKTGRPFIFEILLNDKSNERFIFPFVNNLHRLGIIAKVRTLDDTTYQERVSVHDYGMILARIWQSPSLGNEQRDYFGSDKADNPGSYNYAGIKDPIIDKLIEKIINAPDYETLLASGRALDRVLLWGYYMVPAWHFKANNLAYWDRFGMPSIMAKYWPINPFLWWIDKEKDERLQNSPYYRKSYEANDKRSSLAKIVERFSSIKGFIRKKVRGLG